MNQFAISIVLPELIPDGVEKSAASILFYSATAHLVTFNREQKNIVFFEARTPLDVIYSWRNAREIENGMVDYQQFKSFGFKSSNLDNQLGLAILESDNDNYGSIAEKAFEAAYTANSGDNIVAANFGLMKARRNKFDDAFIKFKSVESYLNTDDSNQLYWLAFARSALAVSTSNGSILSEELFRIIDIALSKNKAPLYTEKYVTWLQEIEQARLSSSEVVQ